MKLLVSEANLLGSLTTVVFPRMLIDEFLPSFDFTEHHLIDVNSEPSKIYETIRQMSFESSRLTKFLFRLRGLPASATTLEGLQKAGFILLGERPRQEIVLGIVGKFWTTSGCIQFLTPNEFLAFNTPGYAKAAWNLAISEISPTITRLSTETRILCLGRQSLLLFRAYWFFVRPFSGIIRRNILRAMKYNIEGQVS